MPKKDTNERINIIITKQQSKNLHKISKETGLSKSEVFRRAFDIYSSNYEKDKIILVKNAKEKWMKEIDKKMVPDNSNRENYKIVKTKKKGKIGFIMVAANNFKEPYCGQRIIDEDSEVLKIYKKTPNCESGMFISWESITSIGFVYHEEDNHALIS